MTVIDVEARCRRLGIDPDDLDAANHKMHTRGRTKDSDTLENYLADVRALPEREMVAYVRWGNLHKRFPDHFDWNGARQ